MLSAGVRGTFWKLGTVLLVVLPLGGCGEARDRARGPAPGGPPPRVARDDATGVSFRVQADRLTVSVPPRAGDELLDKPLELFCGGPEEFGIFGASARAQGRIPASSRATTVRLGKDVSGNLGFCGVEGETGEEAFGYFVPEQELLRETERRLREPKRRGADDKL